MLLIDNDAVIKFAAWELVERCLSVLSATWDDCRRLASLKFILLSKKAELLASLTEHQFERIVDVVDRLPVLDDEIDAELANELLDIDGIDPGEAAILSGLLSSPESLLLTGDKRALSAFVLAASAAHAESAKGRCHCIESVLLLLIARYEYDEICQCLNRAHDLDTVVRVCLGHSGNASESDFRNGLNSYLKNFDGAALIGAPGLRVRHDQVS